MTDFKLFTRCGFCKRFKLYIAKSTITLPTGEKATSKKLMCGGCARAVRQVISNQKSHGE